MQRAFRWVRWSWVAVALSAALMPVDLSAAPQSEGEKATETPHEGGLVEEIDFEGLQRVEAAAIRVLLSSRRGKPYRPQAVAEDIRAIYGMGYFQDVKAYTEETGTGGVRLVFVVTEKPAVARVEIKGNDDVSEEDIKNVVDIRPFTILSEAKV